jgi:hypothetical protein
MAHKREFRKTVRRRIFMRRQIKMQKALLYDKGFVVGDYDMSMISGFLSPRHAASPGCG